MVDFGNLVNKAKDFARKNPDKVRDGLDKAEDAISSKTGGKYDSQIQSATDKVEKGLGVEDHKGDKADGETDMTQGDPQEQDGDKSN